HYARGEGGAPLHLVHRDVTPRNVMVATDGTARLLDFGIARARDKDGTTRDGYVRGTLPYMAPEQLHGEKVTAASDLYAAAAVLWELLTGRRLFQGETEAAVVKRILDHDVRAPSELVPGLPAGFDGVAARGLASEPDARYRSGLEMALALEACAVA